jgi:hypothetical protein
MPHRQDPLVRALLQLGDDAEALLDQNRGAQEQFLWAQANRHGLLRIHGWSGITIGASMLFFGTASTFEDTFGLWVRWALGLGGILGGALVTWGVSQTPRHIRIEGAGMSILAVWDLAILLSFVAIFRVHPPNPVWPWQPLPPDASRVYPMFVYGTLFALLALHVSTLRALVGKGRRR